MTWTPWSLQSWQGGPSTEHVKGITERSPSQGQIAQYGREAPRNGTGRGEHADAGGLSGALFTPAADGGQTGTQAGQENVPKIF